VETSVGLKQGSGLKEPSVVRTSKGNHYTKVIHLTEFCWVHYFDSDEILGSGLSILSILSHIFSLL